jgi:hypothetical protein
MAQSNSDSPTTHGLSYIDAWLNPHNHHPSAHRGVSTRKHPSARGAIPVKISAMWGKEDEHEIRHIYHQGLGGSAVRNTLSKQRQMHNRAHDTRCHEPNMESSK